MTQDKATKRPWYISEGKGTFIYQTDILTEDSEGHIVIGRVHFKENAKLIVKAVNCHDELVEALKEADAVLTNQDGRVKEIIKLALSKAQANQ